MITQAEVISARLAYERDGATCMRQVVDLRKAQQLLDEALRKQDVGDRLTDEMQMARRFPSFWSCIEPLAEIAAKLMSSDVVRFYNDHLFIKRAGESTPTLWHQDLPHWPFSGDTIIAAWIALTPVPQEASAVQYVRGSHRLNRYYRPAEYIVTDRQHPDYLRLDKCPDYFDPAVRQNEEFLSWDLNAGDVLWHHPLIVHGAYANESRTNPLRVGFTVRFLGSAARWNPPPYLKLLIDPPTTTPGALVDDDNAFPVLWRAT